MAVKAGTAYVDIEGDFSALNKQVASHFTQLTKQGKDAGQKFSSGFATGVGAERGKVGRQADSLGREFSSSFNKHVSKLGSGISASLHRNAVRGIQVGAAGIAGAFVFAVKSAADFEQQMSNLGAVSNASGKQMKAFEKQAISAGAKTKFSAKEAAKAQTELAKGGLSVREILSGGLNAALGLAAAGEMDLADAASTTVNAMKLFNIRGKDSGKIADALATAANATTADVSDFAAALSQGGSAAKTAGLSFQETTAWLEALASAGIKNSDAGTSLKTALVQLASPTKAAAGLMKDLGLKFFDAHGNIKKLTDISAMLRDKMGGLTKEQRIQVATTLAGTDGMRGLLALYDAGPAKIGKYERGLNKSGTAADVAKKKQDNLKGALENLQGSVETLAIQAGTAMIPSIRKVTGQLTDFTNDVSKIFSDKNLSFTEKMNAIWAKAKFRFGPMVENIVQGIKDAHLDQKLSKAIEIASPHIAKGFLVVGKTAAGVFLDAFMAAPVWAKFVGGGLILKKLGLAGPAFKALTNVLTGKGIGGGGGGVVALGASPANPMYVVVENWAKIAGGGAAFGAGGKKFTFDPAAGGTAAGSAAAGAAAASLTSKLKTVIGPKLLRGVGWTAGAAIGGEIAGGLVGSIVGGEAGKKIDKGISRAALWGGIGATAGSIIAPGIGTALGAAGGAIAGGLSAALTKAKPDIQKLGQKVALTLPVDIQPRLTPQFTQTAGQLQSDIDKRTADIAKRSTPFQGVTRGGPIPKAKEQVLKDLALNEADKAKIAKDYADLGNLVGDAYVQGVEQHHQFFGADELTKGFTEQLNKLKPQARQAAFNTMVDFARGLEDSGRLPKGATGQIITSIKNQLGLLPSGFRDIAKRGMDSLANQLKRRDAVNAANRQMTELKRTWGDFPNIAKFSGQNAAQNFASEIEFLRGKVKNSTGQMKRSAQADLKGVEDAARKYGHGANVGLDAELQDMGVKGSKHARSIRDRIKRAFENMAQGVGTSSGQASQSLYSALQNMGVNADDILKALGLKPPPFVLHPPPLAPGPNGQLRPTQRGGLIPGARIGDRIPSLLEEGEYVLNRKAVRKVGKSALDRVNFGDAPRFQRGGMVTGDTDVLPGMLARLEELARAAGQAIFITSGRRTMAEQAALYRSKGAYSATNPGAAAPTPNAPHVRGIAADISPGVGVFGSLAGRFGLSFPLGNEPWHIQLTDAGAGGAGAAAAAIVEHVKGVTIDGPGGVLKSAAQGTANLVRDAINTYIDRHAADVTSVGAGGGLSKAQLMNLWTRAGGPAGVADLAARIALAESGGIPSRNNADRPGDGGRHIAAGLWQILGLPFEGNVYDPLTNARMAVAKYEAAGGFSPWEVYTKGLVRQLGGLVELQKGGVPKKYLVRPPKKTTKKVAAAVKAGKKQAPGTPKNLWWFKKTMPALRFAKKLVNKAHRVKKDVPNKGLNKKLQDKIGAIGFTEQQNKLKLLENNVNTFADYAQRTSDILDTDDLQTKLNAELVRVGLAKGLTVEQMAGMSEAALGGEGGVFPPAQQSAFIDAYKRINASYGGKIDVEWLRDEIGALLLWRNQMISDLYTGNPTLYKMEADAIDQWKKWNKEILRIVDLIAKYEKERDKVKERITDVRAKRDDALQKRREELKKPKKKQSAKRLAKLNRDIAFFTDQEAALRHGQYSDLVQLRLISGSAKNPPFKHSLQWYVNTLGQLNADKTAYTTNATTLGGDDGTDGVPAIGAYGGTIGDIHGAIDAVTDSLNNVHGLGSVLTPFASTTEYAFGTLGGTILSVQRQLLDLTSHPPTASAPASPVGSESEAVKKELELQLAREANQRLQLRLAQDDIFRELPLTFGNFPAGQGFPFGGFFQEGGTVPGPIGAPRTIVAHGGEYVVPNDASIGPRITINVASGMEWLKQFIDVRVEDQTRTQTRRSERQLPGRAGLLTR